MLIILVNILQSTTPRYGKSFNSDKFGGGPEYFKETTSGYGLGGLGASDRK